MKIALARSRVGVLAVFCIALMVLGLCVAYAAGMINTLGYEKQRLTHGNAISGGGAERGFGLKTMPFLKGQTVYVTYDVAVRRGSFEIGVIETHGPVGRTVRHVERITASGTGETTYRIPKTSIYTVYFGGSDLGNNDLNGYDVSYSVRWGVRW